MTSAAAVLSLRFGALPTGLGALVLVAFAATFVMYWVPAWLLWVLATALVLLARPTPPTAVTPGTGHPRARSAR